MRMSKWHLLKNFSFEVPTEEAEGDRIAAKLQQIWSEECPKGDRGMRCIFKWDNGSFYYALIPWAPKTFH